MDDLIKISQLNDFIFCPVSIYFHNLYGNQNVELYKKKEQVNGTNAHKTVDGNQYSTRRDVLTGIDIYSEKYGLTGKIDIYDSCKKILTERKNKIVKIYDGYIFQLYGQYFSMVEMGYEIVNIRLHSLSDNKIYPLDLPDNNVLLFEKFEKVIEDMHSFEMKNFKQTNEEKCLNCIYEPACDRGLI